MPVFDFENYKQFIRQQIKENSDIRGYQSKLAEAAGCQKSYFSQVLNAGAQLTSEQAMRLAQFWSFTFDEVDWFLAIVDLARTQYEPLKKRLRGKLTKMKAEHDDLASRYRRPKLDQGNIESVYYSAWYWSAIHIITSIPTFRKPEEIARRLTLPVEVVKECLNQLKPMGLVENRGTEWKMRPEGLHLPSTSPFVGIQHFNWRQKAIQDAHQKSKDSLHYTDVVSHSFEDFHLLRSMLLKTIDEWRDKVRVSHEEELSCLCLDFFRV